MAGPNPNKRNHDAHVAKDGYSSGRYAESPVVFGDGKEGTLAIEMCAECGYIYAAVCLHVKMEWNSDGTVLTCKLCGVDGT